MPLFGEVKRTYSRKPSKVSTAGPAHVKKANGVKKANFGSKNSTLEDSLWKDSFDRLLEDKP